MKKALVSLFTIIATVIAVPAVAFAHVVVAPGQAGIGQRVLFNLSVPNERESAVTSIKLTIPAEVSDVMPTTTAGWTISTKGSQDNVTAITWAGNIPVGERADLTFKAQTPSQASTLIWKAYQTYDDGTVVSWDQKPSDGEHDDDSANSGPYSVTTVTNDLNNNDATPKAAGNITLAIVFAAAALVLSVAALFLKLKDNAAAKKQKK